MVSHHHRCGQPLSRFQEWADALDECLKMKSFDIYRSHHLLCSSRSLPFLCIVPLGQAAWSIEHVISKWPKIVLRTRSKSLCSLQIWLNCSDDLRAPLKAVRIVHCRWGQAAWSAQVPNKCPLMFSYFRYFISALDARLSFQVYS